MKCVNCGNELSDNSKECSNCGYVNGIGQYINKKNVAIAGGSVLAAGLSAVGISKLAKDNNKTSAKENIGSIEKIEENIVVDNITNEENVPEMNEDFLIEEIPNEDIENIDIVLPNDTNKDTSKNYNDSLEINGNSKPTKKPISTSNDSNENDKDESEKKEDIIVGDSNKEDYKEEKDEELEESEEENEDEETEESEEENEDEETEESEEENEDEETKESEEENEDEELEDSEEESEDEEEFDGYGNVGAPPSGGYGDGGVNISALALETAIAVLGGTPLHPQLGASEIGSCSHGGVRFENFCEKLGEVRDKESQDKNYPHAPVTEEKNTSTFTGFLGEGKMVDTLLKSLISLREQQVFGTDFSSGVGEDAYINSINEEISGLAMSMGSTESAVDYLVAIGAIQESDNENAVEAANETKATAAALVSYATGEVSEYWNTAQSELTEANYKDSELYNRNKSLGLSYEQTKELYESYCDGLAASAFFNSMGGLINLNDHMTDSGSFTFDQFIYEQFNSGFYGNDGTMLGTEQKSDEQKTLERVIYGQGLSNIESLYGNENMLDAVTAIDSYIGMNFDAEGFDVRNLHPGDHIYDLLEVGVKNGAFENGVPLTLEEREEFSKVFNDQLLSTCIDRYMSILNSRTSAERIITSSFEEYYHIINRIYDQAFPAFNESQEELEKFFLKKPDGSIRYDEYGLPMIIGPELDGEGKPKLDENGNEIIVSSITLEEQQTITQDAREALTNYYNALNDLNMYNNLVVYTDASKDISMYSQVLDAIKSTKLVDDKGNIKDWEKLYDTTVIPDNVAIYLDYLENKGNASDFITAEHSSDSKEGEQVASVKALTYTTKNEKGEEVIYTVGEDIAKALSFSLVENELYYKQQIDVINKSEFEYETVHKANEYREAYEANKEATKILANPNRGNAYGYYNEQETIKEETAADALEFERIVAEEYFSGISDFATRNTEWEAMKYASLEDKIDMGYILSEIEMEFMQNYERSILSEIPTDVEQDSDLSEVYQELIDKNSEKATLYTQLGQCSSINEALAILEQIKATSDLITLKNEAINTASLLTDENTKGLISSISISWDPDAYMQTIEYLDENGNVIDPSKLDTIDIELYYARNPEDFDRAIDTGTIREDRILSLMENSNLELDILAYKLNEDAEFRSRVIDRKNIECPISSIEIERNWIGGIKNIHYYDDNGNLISPSDSDRALYFALNPEDFSDCKGKLDRKTEKHIETIRMDLDNNALTLGSLYYNEDLASNNFYTYLVENGNLQIAMRNFETYQSKLDERNNFGDWVATEWEGIKRGTNQFIDGVNNFFDPDGIRSVNDYNSMLMSQYLSESERWFLSASYDITTSLANMAPTILISSIPIPGMQAVGLALMGLSSAGNSVEGYLQEGMSIEEAYTRGIIKGVLEVGTTYILGGIGKLSKGGVSFLKRLSTKSGESVLNTLKISMLEQFSKKTSEEVVSSTLSAFAKGAFLDQLSEGFEEFIQTYLDAAVDNIFNLTEDDYNQYKSDVSNMTYEEYLTSKFKQWQEEARMSGDSTTMGIAAFTSFDSWLDDYGSNLTKEAFEMYKENVSTLEFSEWIKDNRISVDPAEAIKAFKYGFISAGLTNSFVGSSGAFTSYGAQMVSYATTGSTMGLSTIWNQISSSPNIGIFERVATLNNVLQQMNQNNVDINSIIQNEYFGKDAFENGYKNQVQAETDAILEQHDAKSQIGKVFDRLFGNHELSGKTEVATEMVVSRLLQLYGVETAGIDLNSTKIAIESYTEVKSKVDSIKLEIEKLQEELNNLNEIKKSGKEYSGDIDARIKEIENSINILKNLLGDLLEKTDLFSLIIEEALEMFEPENRNENNITSYEETINKINSQIENIERIFESHKPTESGQKVVDNKLSGLKSQLAEAQAEFDSFKGGIVQLFKDPSKGIASLNPEQLNYFLTKFDPYVLNLFSSDIIANLDSLSDANIITLLNSSSLAFINVYKVELLNRIAAITDPEIKSLGLCRINELIKSTDIVKELKDIADKFENIRNSSKNEVVEEIEIVEDNILNLFSERVDTVITEASKFNGSVTKVSVESIKEITLDDIRKLEGTKIEGTDKSVSDYIWFSYGDLKLSVSEMSGILKVLGRDITSIQEEINTASDSLFSERVDTVITEASKFNGSVTKVSIESIKEITLDDIRKLEGTKIEGTDKSVSDYVWFSYGDLKLSVSEMSGILRLFGNENIINKLTQDLNTKTTTENIVEAESTTTTEVETKTDEVVEEKSTTETEVNTEESIETKTTEDTKTTTEVVVETDTSVDINTDTSVDTNTDILTTLSPVALQIVEKLKSIKILEPAIEELMQKGSLKQLSSESLNLIIGNLDYNTLNNKDVLNEVIESIDKISNSGVLGIISNLSKENLSTLAPNETNPTVESISKNNKNILTSRINGITSETVRVLTQTVLIQQMITHNLVSPNKTVNQQKMTEMMKNSNTPLESIMDVLNDPSINSTEKIKLLTTVLNNFIKTETKLLGNIEARTKELINSAHDAILKLSPKTQFDILKVKLNNMSSTIKSRLQPVQALIQKISNIPQDIKTKVESIAKAYHVLLEDISSCLSKLTTAEVDSKGKFVVETETESKVETVESNEIEIDIPETVDLESSDASTDTDEGQQANNTNQKNIENDGNETTTSVQIKNIDFLSYSNNLQLFESKFSQAVKDWVASIKQEKTFITNYTGEYILAPGNYRSVNGILRGQITKDSTKLLFYGAFGKPPKVYNTIDEFVSMHKGDILTYYNQLFGSNPFNDFSGTETQVIYQAFLAYQTKAAQFIIQGISKFKQPTGNEGIILYREQGINSISKKYGFTIDQSAEEIFKALTTDSNGSKRDHFVFDSFTSSSINDRSNNFKTEKNVFFKIKCDETISFADVMQVSNVGEVEGEILLNAGQHFRIESVEKNSVGNVVITLAPYSTTETVVKATANTVTSSTTANTVTSSTTVIDPVISALNYLSTSDFQSIVNLNLTEAQQEIFFNEAIKNGYYQNVVEMASHFTKAADILIQKGDFSFLKNSDIESKVIYDAILQIGNKYGIKNVNDIINTYISSSKQNALFIDLINQNKGYIVADLATLNVVASRAMMNIGNYTFLTNPKTNINILLDAVNYLKSIGKLDVFSGIQVNNPLFAYNLFKNGVNFNYSNDTNFKKHFYNLLMNNIILNQGNKFLANKAIALINSMGYQNNIIKISNMDQLLGAITNNFSSFVIDSTFAQDAIEIIKGVICQESLQNAISIVNSFVVNNSQYLSDLFNSNIPIDLKIKLLGNLENSIVSTIKFDLSTTTAIYNYLSDTTFDKVDCCNLLGLNSTDSSNHFLAVKQIAELSKTNARELILIFKNNVPGSYQYIEAINMLKQNNQSYANMSAEEIVKEVIVNYGRAQIKLYDIGIDRIHTITYNSININIYCANPNNFSTALTRVKHIINIIDSLPAVLRFTITELNVYDTNNPFDEYWACEYDKDINSGFYSAATGGFGQVNIWNYMPQIDTIAHELGHCLDSGIYKHIYGNEGYITEIKPEWSNAIAADGNSISSYGNKAIVEDFAESVKLYITNPTEFFKYYRNRAKVLMNMFNQYLEKELGINSKMTKSQINNRLIEVGLDNDIIKTYIAQGYTIYDIKNAWFRILITNESFESAIIAIRSNNNANGFI